MGAFAGPEILQQNLLFHFDAANSRSYPGTGTTWTDLSGNGRNGSLTNGPTFVSTNPKYFTFDGSNDTVNLEIDLRRSWSYECIVMHNSVSSFSFLGQGGFSNNAGLHIWFGVSSSIRFGFYANDSDTSTITTNTGVWYHYVFIYIIHLHLQNKFIEMELL
jgi:hypothetical protein